MNPLKHSTVFCSRSIFVIIFIFVICNLCCSGLLQAAMTGGDLRVEISVKNRPLKEVVHLVQKQTGYKVELKFIDESFLVSGEYSNVNVEKIFTRLLKGYNVSVAINNLDKSISVISLGDKVQLSNGSKIAATASPIAAEINDPETIFPPVAEVDPASSDKPPTDPLLMLTGLSSKNTEALHVQQEKELQLKHNDPTTVDPLTGLSFAELEEMHEKQAKELNQPVK